jgi:uncharacterized protein involved in outer membrane biogenesis
MNPRSWSVRTRRNLWILFGLLGVFTVTGFFVLPPIVRSQLEKRLGAALGREVTVGKVRLNPYALSVTIERLEIHGADKKSAFAGWDRLYVNFDAVASLGGDWVLHAVELDGFRLAAAIEPDGKPSFADILAKLSPASDSATAPKTAAEPSRPVRVGSLKVDGARVDFTDRSRARPFATVVGPLSFHLTEFRTVGERGAPYRFAATTEAGEKLEWQGTLSADPLRSKGELKLENIALAKYAAYYADRTQTELTNGSLSVRGRYEVDLSASPRVLRLADGTMELRGLKLLERATNASAFELAAFEVAGAEFDAVKRAGRVASVRASGGRVAVRRETDGTLNWLAMLAPALATNSAAANVPATNAPASAAPAAPTAMTPASPLPDVHVGEVALQDFQIEVADLAAPRPAKLALGAMQFSLRDVSLADGAEMPLQLAFEWAPQGKVSVTGKVGVRPDLRAELQAEVADFALLPLSPYLEQHLNARIAQGAVSFRQSLRLAPGASGAAITVSGDLRVDRLGLVDGTLQEELAGFTSLALSGIEVATAPTLSASLKEVALVGPYARAVVREDKSVNLTGLVRGAPAPTTGAAAPTVAAASSSTPTAGAAPRITIGAIKIEAGDFSFLDRSLSPHVRVALGQFGGTIGGLSSENLARADVDLRGTVDGVGPVAITGQLDPLGTPRFVDVKVDFKNVDLLPLSPYSGKYAGYELARGKLALDVKAHVEGSQLRSENVLTLQQFTFGAPVESPEATKLPVRLGVALLKDIEGRIVIDVPVSGDLSDPNLKISRVVWRVIGNLLTKAAVSPFALLGSMFGGGGDELAFQEFDPGLAELRAAERGKLDTLVKALTNRPGLSLGLEGGYDGPADTFVLQRQKVAALVRAKIWDERRAADPNLPPPDRLEIAPEAYAANLKQLFDEKFPPGTQFGTPVPAAPTVANPPPAPPRGFFKRVVRTLTFAETREKRAVAAENEKRAAEHEQLAAAAVAAGLPVEEMTGRLATTMEVTPDDLRALAATRAQRVRDYLVDEGKIAIDRLFLTQPKEAQKENKGPRVFLTLQ